MLMSVNFLLLLLNFFEHAGIKIAFLFCRLCDGPLLFGDDGLNGDFGLVMILEVKFDFSVCCVEFEGVLFAPEDATFLKIRRKDTVMSID